MKRYIVILLVLFSFVYSYAQENIREINIVHWNDFHARNEPYKTSKKKEGEVINYYIGGTGSMLGYLNKYRNKNSLVMHGGDDFQGSPISSITKGKSQVELMNLYGIDAFVVGNHEFDYGYQALDSALGMANFDILSGNVYRVKDQKTFGKSYVIKEKNGVKVGIIGVSPIDLKTLTLPKNVEGLEVLNTDSVIAACIKELKSQKCNLIVLLSHCGNDEDKYFAETFHRDIDVIIGGHSHTPIFKPQIVDGVLICQAGSYGKYIGKIDMKVDIDKDTVVSYFGFLKETVLDSNIFDKKAGEKVDGMIAAIEPEMKKVIGTLETPWKKDNCGQWTADALRSMFKTDVAFMNAGSIRKDLPKGDITVGDIWEINPFGNSIVTFKIKGSTLKKMMANNITKAMKDETLNDYDMIIISGMKIKIDGSQKNPKNPEDIIVSIKLDGKNLDPDKTYTVCTNSYTASQAKKYFGNFGVELDVTDTNVIDRDALMDAVKEQKVINSVYEKRVVDEK
ncbi:MAG: bifunctional metallophosphatase/5'-nucleotidase [Bacteroidetes bacterium]|nr:bifunctional metallophosphatase/5'-nucleotidase [Bacteroidota bacterium]